MINRQPSLQLTEDEWIIPLDVYLSHPARRLTSKHPAISQASLILNALGEADGRPRGLGFLPPSGLHRQVRMFQRLESATGPDKATVLLLASAAWEQPSNNAAECHKAAEAVRARLG